MKEYLGIILLGVLAAITVLLWWLVGFKEMLLFLSTVSLMMYLHITVTTLCNALVGREFSALYDAFWKLFFMLLSCVGFSVYFSL